jgi:hypothetical protein
MRCAVIGLFLLFATEAHADDVTLRMGGSPGATLQLLKADRDAIRWVDVCLSPCREVRVPRSGFYRIAPTSYMRPSEEFMLHPDEHGDVRLTVDAGRPTARIAGLAVTGVSAAAVFIGGIVALTGALVTNAAPFCFTTECPPQAPESRGVGAEAVGATMAGFGAIGIILGLAVFGTNNRTSVSQDTATFVRVNGDAYSVARRDGVKLAQPTSFPVLRLTF